MASRTHSNIKFLAIARAMDKVIVASCHVHSMAGSSSREGRADMKLCRDMLNRVLRAPTWKSQVIPNGRHSLECDVHKLHFTMTIDELVFAAVTLKEYPIRLAFQMLVAVQQMVVPICGARVLTCAENGLDQDCTQPLAAIAATYDDLMQRDKLSEVLSQVHDVKSVMHESIRMALANTEKIEVVDQKTKDLTEQAKVFCHTGRQLIQHVW